MQESIVKKTKAVLHYAVMGGCVCCDLSCHGRSADRIAYLLLGGGIDPTSVVVNDKPVLVRPSTDTEGLDYMWRGCAKGEEIIAAIELLALQNC